MPDDQRWRDPHPWDADRDVPRAGDDQPPRRRRHLVLTLLGLLALVLAVAFLVAVS